MKNNNETSIIIKAKDEARINKLAKDGEVVLSFLDKMPEYIAHKKKNRNKTIQEAEEKIENIPVACSRFLVSRGNDIKNILIIANG